MASSVQPLGGIFFYVFHTAFAIFNLRRETTIKKLCRLFANAMAIGVHRFDFLDIRLHGMVRTYYFTVCYDTSLQKINTNVKVIQSLQEDDEQFHPILAERIDQYASYPGRLGRLTSDFCGVNGLRGHSSKL